MTFETGSTYPGVTSGRALTLLLTALLAGCSQGQTAERDLSSQEGALVSPNAAWTARLGGTGNEQISGAAIDSAGNVIVAGQTSTTFDSQTALGLGEGFVTKYSSGGTKQWTRVVGTTAADVAFGVAVGTSDSLYTTGYVRASIDGQTFGGGTDLFVSKLDSSGTRLWSRQQGASGNDVGYGVAVRGGAVVVAGLTATNLPGSTAAGGTDIAIVRYDESGALSWAKSFGSSQADQAAGAAIDASGNVYVAGTAGAALPGMTALGGKDIFLAKYDAAGTRLWISQVGTSADDSGTGVTIGADDGIYVSGTTAGGMSGPLAGATDAVLVKFNASGAVVWTKQLGGVAADEALGIASDSSFIYLSGRTAGQLPGANAGTTLNFFAAKYDPNGTVQTVREYAGGITTAGISVGIAAANGRLILAGGVTSATFDGRPGLGNNDGVVLSLCSDHNFSCELAGSCSTGGCTATQTCTPSAPGVVLCGCSTGYTGSMVCSDVNECTVNNGGCDALTTCANTVGSRTCTACPGGYTGTGATGCVDTNECLTNNGGCDALTTCTNTPGSFSCSACPAGYTGTGATWCVDVDECANPASCDSLTTCTNTLGSFTCSACPAGFTGTGQTGCFGAPTGVSATGGNASATVTWTAPVAHGNDPILSFVVTCNPGNKEAIAVGAAATVSGLTNGTAYTCTVRGTSASQQGPESAASNSITPAGPPSAPTSVTAVAASGQVTLSWTAPANTGGANITGYVVLSSPGAATATTTGATTATVTGLTNGTPYTFTVYATNSHGNGQPSAGVIATPTTSPAWTARLGGTGNEQISGAAIDSAGNVIVAGQTSTTFDSQTALGLGEGFVTKYSSGGTKQWTRVVGTPAADVALAVAVGTSDSLFVTGYVRASIDGQTFGGGTDLFVSKLDSSGTRLWSRQQGAAGNDVGYGLAVRGGAVVIAGLTATTLPGSTAAGGTDIAIVRYDESGTLSWAKSFGSNQADQAAGAAIDASGNVYVAGTAGAALPGMTALGGKDIFLTKYNPSGTRLWISQIGTAADDSGTGVAIGADDGIYVSGTTAGGMSGPLAGATDAVLVKFNASGAVVWTRQLGGTSTDEALGIASDSSFIYLSGRTAGQLPGANAGTTLNFFAAKYDTSGTVQTVREYAGGITTAGVTVGIAAANGRLVLAGGVTSATFDGRASLGNNDGVVLSLCSDNNFSCQLAGSCGTNNGGCTASQTCTPDVSGLVLCGCGIGYSGSMVCSDVNECAVNNGGCDALTTCANTVGGRTCSNCPGGYTGNGATGCIDVDECTTHNGGCDALTTCTNTTGSFSCGSCPNGYTGNGATGCVDVDECATNNGGCDPRSLCTNTPGTFSCGDCPAGYVGTGAIGCFDVDECASGDDGCDSLTTCINTPGAFSCSACPSGYAGTGATGCVDVDECASGNGGCDPLTTCTNTVGSVSCGGCPAGYSGSGATGCAACPSAGDLCVTGGCVNPADESTCTCRPGYTTAACGGAFTCVNIDECASDNGGCDPLATCQDAPGSRACLCPSGYAGEGTLASPCVEVDECAQSPSVCPPGQVCANTPGSFTCGPACLPGFTGDASTGCVDIDECSAGGCDPLVACTNTPGSFACGACPSGYRGTGLTGCVDIDECNEYITPPQSYLDHIRGSSQPPILPKLIAECSRHRQCINTPGSYECGPCITGLEEDGPHMCKDINECLVNNGGCSGFLHEYCTNIIPAFEGDRLFLCGSDRFLDENGDPFYGEGIFPCQVRNGGCESHLDGAGQPAAVCRDTTPAISGPVEVTCEPRSGFHGNGFDAFDDSECANGGQGLDPREKGPNVSCVDFFGSYATYCAAPLVPSNIPWFVRACELPDRCGNYPGGNAPCFPGATCTTVPVDRGATYACGACPAHMTGNAANKTSGCACDQGYANANGSWADGCESFLATDVANCGAMGNVCPTPVHSTATCSAGSCGYLCEPGFADPDGLSSTGCEAMIATCH